MNSNHYSDHGKSALVLAGGGLTGAVYEIGALRAIDDLLVDRTVNDFDIYVGTSAGALVASLLASGLSPEMMLKVLDGTRADIGAIQRHHLFKFNIQDMLKWSVKIPTKMLGTWAQYILNRHDMTLFDLLWSLTEALPAGMYDVGGLESYVREVLTDLGYSNDFRDLQRELYTIATELNSGERVVFGRGMREDIPISTAVAASSALPLLYQPLSIDGTEYVDGSLRGNASLDLAIEHGATLVVCINPMVPYEHSHLAASKAAPPRRKGAHNIQSVANQSLRIFTHAGLHYHIKQLRRSHPEVDIILIEPRPEDYELFFYNIMRYSARLVVARHGFESATLDLAEEYPRYKQILARHHIPISRRLVIEEIAEIQHSGYDPIIIRKILEARPSGCGQNREGDPICDLTRTLAELELVLDDLSEG